jgi:hypothetical protein
MEAEMKIYQIEQVVVERNNLWLDIQKYIESEAFQYQAHEIEENLFKKLLSLGKSLLSEVFVRFGTGKVETLITNKNSEVLKYHKTALRKYHSVFGVIEISRAIYWEKGLKSICPLDAHFNLPERSYSHLLIKWAQDGVAESPYDEGILRIYNMFGLKLWKKGQEELSREVTVDVDQFYKELPLIDEKTEGSLIVATTDCKGVVMVPGERSEQTQSKAQQQIKARDSRGRKGLKRDAVVTSDYSINPEVRTPEEVLELLMRSQTKEQLQEKRDEEKLRCKKGDPKPREPINKKLMASLKGKASAFEDLADRIAKRDPLGEKKIFLQIDGAKSLEKGLLKEFEKRGWSNRIVGVGLDIIHVMEYVWELSTALHGEKSQERVDWVRKQGLKILQGKTGYVIGGLRQILTKNEELSSSRKKAIKKVITYYDNHKHMMKYDEYLAKGFPIATGVIEGACGSLVKDRMERSGMKWTHKGAQSVLNLRALKRNGDWELYWDFHLKNEHERLYGHIGELEAA